jgi:ankyrin repeat protein
VECVRVLLEAGAPVAQTMQDGITALMVASGQGHVDCVRALLEAGAQVEQAEPNGTSAFIMACARSSTAELEGCCSRQRDLAQARGCRCAGGNETHLRTSADGTDSV